MLNNIFKAIHLTNVQVYILLGIIVLIGFVFRIQGPLHGTFAYTYDVGRDMLAVQKIVTDHKLPLIGPTTGMQGIFYGPWWYYLLTIPYLLFDGNPQGVSYFIAFLGVVTIVLTYFVGRAIRGDPLGLFFAGIVAVSPVLITAQIWNPYMAYPFLALCLLGVVRSTQKNPRIGRWNFIIGLCLGFILDSEIFFGMLFIIGTVIFLGVMQRKQFCIKYGVYLLGGLFIVLSPRIFFELRHNFLMTHSFLNLLVHGLPQEHKTPFISRIGYLIIVFWDLWKNSVGLGVNWFASLNAVLTVISLCFFYRPHTKNEYLLFYPLTILSVFFLYFMTNSTDIFSHFVVGIPYMFILLFMLAISFLPLSHRVIVSGCVLLLFIAILISPRNLHKQFDNMWVGDASVYRNALHAVAYVYADAAGKPFRVEIFTPNAKDDPYRYLLSWVSRTRHFPAPTVSVANGYVILEEDTQYNGYRRNIWLSEHKNDGTIVSEKKLTGDITVQKRRWNSATAM